MAEKTRSSEPTDSSKQSTTRSRTETKQRISPTQQTNQSIGTIEPTIPTQRGEKTAKLPSTEGLESNAKLVIDRPLPPRPTVSF